MAIERLARMSAAEPKATLTSGEPESMASTAEGAREGLIEGLYCSADVEDP
jgi:hypothetical protein